jgi:hypothetical protein
LTRILPQYKKRFFIPYVVLDAVFFLLAVVGCVIGLIVSDTHLFRISFIFMAIKFYVEFCVISLFREYKEKSKAIEITQEAAERNVQGSQSVIEEPKDGPAPV